MSNSLYNETTIIGKLNRYFSCYFETFSAPTAETLFLFVLSMLALESAGSIRFLYRHFLAKVTEKSLNAFYYACSYAKADYSRFMEVTASMALKMIPALLDSQPVFLCIDDTVVPKQGKKFEEVSKLFDHAAHNGSYYLNGHCFVSLMLRVPVFRPDRKITYLAIPLGYRMWQKKESKLTLAASMVRRVMPSLSHKKNVILLCDSWYAKKNLACAVDEFQNLDMVCNARCDSVLYDLPPGATGKKGRPAKHGRRLSVEKDFDLSGEKIGDYYAGARCVLTNIFGDRKVLAYVTSPSRGGGPYRLFFSTVSPARLSLFCAWQEKEPLNQTGSDRMQYIPLMCYSFRWAIETSYYEQKTFWSFCGYMVRSRKGIEMMVNLVNIAYCAMKLLPYREKEFAGYRTASVQEFRFFLSEQIRQQVIFAAFVRNAETALKSNMILDTLKHLVRQQGCHL